MKIWVSSLRQVHETAAGASPASVVSLLSPGDIFPSIEGLDADEHHKVHLHDIREPMDGHVTPGEEHVSNLISFLKGWDPDGPLLVHCWAGISRSTATAFIAACMHNEKADEQEIISAIADASPTAYPNTLIVAHADNILGRNGRMQAAADAMCADEDRRARAYGALESVPFHITARF